MSSAAAAAAAAAAASSKKSVLSNIAVRFTKIIPKPDPIHGSPCSRSSHGLDYIPASGGGGDGGDNKKKVVKKPIRLFLHGGEHVARTALSSSSQINEMTWLAELQDDYTTWQWRCMNKQQQQHQQHPPPRLAHAQAYSPTDDSVYIFGGRTGIDMQETALQDLWRFDCQEEEWYECSSSSSSTSLPQARSFHKMLHHNKNLYVFGGCGAQGGRLSDLWRYDLETKQWHELGESKFLAGRGGANLLLLHHDDDTTTDTTTDTDTTDNDDDGGYYLAVVAGFSGQETKDGHIFSIQKAGGAWEDLPMDTLQDLRPRSVCVAGSFVPTYNIVLIFGGEVNPSEKGHEGVGGFTNDVVLMDGTTRQIRTIRPPSPAPAATTATAATTAAGSDNNNWPTARGWSDGAAYDGCACLYFFGGLAGDDENPIRLDDLWRCDVLLDG